MLHSRRADLTPSLVFTVKGYAAAIVANMFGFDEKLYFESDEGAEIAPTVEF